MVKQTIIAWAEDEDRSGAVTGLDGIGDQIATVVGDTIEQPAAYPLIAQALAATEFDAYPLGYVRLDSPNINGPGVNSLYLRKGDSATSKAFNVYDWCTFPRLGVPGQAITGYSLEDDEAGVAHMNSVALMVSDGPLTYGPRPITHIVDCTLGAATALTWTSAVPGLTNQIPAGTFIMWGADFVAPTGIACRFIIPGIDHRPGVFARRNEDDSQHPFSWCFNPNGYPLVHKGGTLNLTAEYLCYTTDTPKLQLYLQKVG